MVVFPNAKINLGLHIQYRRPDGYHELETVLYPIPLRDILEFRPATADSFTVTGMDVPGHAADNLVMRALALLRQHYEVPPLAVHLHKLIPMGAGLGGGSADAAFLLTGLNAYWQLGASNEKLMQLAAQLGADCPVFIANEPRLATGIGTQLQPIMVILRGYYLAVVHPGIAISSKAAYAQVQPQPYQVDFERVLMGPPEAWHKQLRNSFEASVFAQYPEIEKIKNQLYEMGANYAALSGSGSAVFGIFDHPPKLAAQFGAYFYWEGKL